ncbi:MAG: hypothetical protein H0T79_01115 [Deltaproteobacteria bacterium]|nr:hypothetical protein [Deltaproteobacteria bacterium]
MKIDAMLLPPVIAVVSSGLLLVAGQKRIFELIALIASAAWLVLQLGLVAWPVTQASYAVVLGGTLLATGVLVYLKVTNKREVTASTVVAILGGMLLVGGLGGLSRLG